MQLKALINNRAKAAGVSPQLMLQNYLLERLIDRIAHSSWRDAIIVKGGMLIGSLIGVDRRTTKDLDTTITGFHLTHETASHVFEDICKTPLDDDLEFSLIRTEDIREIDDYPGIRVHLQARYSPLTAHLTVDITTGDQITPEAIVYHYPFVFDEGSTTILAYPLETILAEKLETVLSRNTATTRVRDFYDIYALWRIKKDVCSIATLAIALRATCEKRNSALVLTRYPDLIDRMRHSKALSFQWDIYASKHTYATEITFEETLDTARAIMVAIEQEHGK